MTAEVSINPVDLDGGYKQSKIDSAGYSGLARRSLSGYRRIRPIVSSRDQSSCCIGD